MASGLPVPASRHHTSIERGLYVACRIRITMNCPRPHSCECRLLICRITDCKRVMRRAVGTGELQDE